MKFTKEEKSLCEQIAEKHRKEIGKGDWYIANDLTLLSTSDAWVGQADIIRHIPLWAISDCLEFLGEQKYHFESLLEDDMCLFKVNILCPDRTGGITTNGGTVLGTLLKAVLAVLEEK